MYGRIDSSVVDSCLKNHPDLPKSPLNAFIKKYQYCSVTGLSRPNSFITLSTSA